MLLRRAAPLGIAAVPLLTLLSLLLSVSHVLALTSRDAKSGAVDFAIARIGVPRIARITAQQYISPRFHRIIQKDRNAKSQTAVFVATEKNVIAALNPRNGGTVWRQILDPADPVQSFKLSGDAMFTLSGDDASTLRLWHALSGHMLWETAPLRGLPFVNETGFDIDLPQSGELKQDVLAISGGQIVRRVDGKSGRTKWTWKAEDIDGSSENQLIRVHATPSHVLVLSAHKGSGSLLSSATYSLKLHVLTPTGDVVKTTDIPASITNGGRDVALVTLGSPPPAPGQADSTPVGAAPPLAPHVVWLHKDGSVRALPLASPVDGKKQPEVQLLRPLDESTRFTSLQEVGLDLKGLLVAHRADGKGQVLRIVSAKNAKTPLDSEFKSSAEFEEDAADAVYAGVYDKQGAPYVSRVFFSRNQHLLNLHVFWPDANRGEGQMTGYSFQYDHDLNGDIYAAPFEVSPMSPYQVVTRAVFVTASGSVRMIQEDQHQWILEEGLSDIEAAVLVDLPEKKLTSSGSSTGVPSAAAAAIGHEGFVHRIARHLLALQGLPVYAIEFVHRFFSGSYGDFMAAAPPLPTAAGEPAYPLQPPKADSGPVKPGVPGQQSEASKRKKEAPPARTALAPRFVDANTTSTLYRDAFGFRKLIVAATRRGKVYALDTGNRGKYVWEKSLVGFGQGQGDEVPDVQVRFMKITRQLGAIEDPTTVDAASAEDSSGENVPAASAAAPILTIVADVTTEGTTITTVFEIDPLTGRFVDNMQTGLPLVLGPAKDVFALPIEDAISGREAVASVDQQNKIKLFPSTTDVQNKFDGIANRFFFVLKSDRSDSSPARLSGFVASSDGSPQQLWQLAFGANEEIVSVLPATHDPVASQGRVLGDRSTLYKYLNPHVQLVTTLDRASRSAGVHLVDGVRGAVLYETRLENIDVTQGVHAAFVENWILVAAGVLNAHEGPVARLLSAEVYDSSKRDQTWDWTGNFSSYGSATSDAKADALAPPLVHDLTFTLPYGVRALGVTRTKFGISFKQVLIATDREQLVSLPRRLLDPRRPVGRKPTTQEQEEGLMPYDALVPFNPKWVVSHFYPLPGARRIVTDPAMLESTSAVLVHGLDLFFTRVAPSGTFDILSESFNKVQLLLTIAGLSAGILFTRPLVRSKLLKARW